MAPSCLAPRALQSSSAAQPGLMLSPVGILLDKDPEKGTGSLPAPVERHWVLQRTLTDC